MGKILCDSATVTDTLPPQSPPLLSWRDPHPPHSLKSTVDLPATTSWDDVTGLEDQQKKNLSRLQAKGVLWKHPDDKKLLPPVVFRLVHGGDVDADGNCLFSAVEKATENEQDGQFECGGGPRELRRRTVKRFENDFELGQNDEREKVEVAIKNLYSPDLRFGWGIHIVQEIKLLAKKSERQIFDDAILQLINLGMLRENAAETIYKERCIAVDDGPSWAKYMSISGSPDDEYDIITLQYTEEGLLTVDENREGRAAAFGDDIAIECLAEVFKREIFVLAFYFVVVGASTWIGCYG
ncbi:uncharacterized protein LOC104897527 isoform X2 [Beta vulgaris subsp. vulgaris]|uniref:uncharacterized protein LOC104897527 isoform X2 n=1 Tax=Beta vulgaris subsp. vulgaris TaxID=3555 RepID=UPI002037400F|nr:uncharacterized protein LOC104897527 isoform X2 [Beta vulgaris subsp. vulgaris]